jgi:hypothetical protein
MHPLLSLHKSRLFHRLNFADPEGFPCVYGELAEIFSGALINRPEAL